MFEISHQTWEGAMEGVLHLLGSRLRAGKEFSETEKSEKGLTVSFPLPSNPTQGDVSLRAWLIPSAITNCCQPNGSWQPPRFPFRWVSLTAATYGCASAPASWLLGEPMAWALQTPKSKINSNISPLAGRGIYKPGFSVLKSCQVFFWAQHEGALWRASLTPDTWRGTLKHRELWRWSLKQSSQWLHYKLLLCSFFFLPFFFSSFPFILRGRRAGQLFATQIAWFFWTAFASSHLNQNIRSRFQIQVQELPESLTAVCF